MVGENERATMASASYRPIQNTSNHKMFQTEEVDVLLLFDATPNRVSLHLNIVNDFNSCLIGHAHDEPEYIDLNICRYIQVESVKNDEGTSAKDSSKS